MKGRESGMPDEAYWATFFDPEKLLRRLLPAGVHRGDIVEFGCGYGTFTLPAARSTSGVVTGLDIEPEMVACVRKKVLEAGVTNVVATVRDFVADGTGLADESQSHAMIFNLLHLEQPLVLLREARRVLMPGASLSVMHWRSDMPTPRGPSLAIRPSPEQCATWLHDAAFRSVEPVELEDASPYHFGLVASL